MYTHRCLCDISLSNLVETLIFLLSFFPSVSNFDYVPCCIKIFEEHFKLSHTVNLICISICHLFNHSNCVFKYAKVYFFLKIFVSIWNAVTIFTVWPQIAKLGTMIYLNPCKNELCWFLFSFLSNSYL